MRRYGLVDIPTEAADIDAVPISRTITINSVTYDLSENRSWIVSAGSTSGGSSVNYYLNGSVAASVATYKQMSFTAIVGTGTDFTLTGDGLISQFLTDIGNPNRVLIPGGAWNFEMFFSSSSNGGNEKFYVELHKYNGSTFTLIASTTSIPEAITGGTSIDLYVTSLAVPETVLATTDRLAIRVYIVDNSVGRTIKLHTENSHLCEIITSFAGGVTSLNALTANTQYLVTGTSGTDFNIVSLVDTHTFNIPTASASNRGALSSADWTTFNSKESALTFSSPLVRTVNAISIPVATTSVNGYLSSTDWTTFNNKQATITLTTTGTSGAATFSANTLNIPDYSAASGVTGSGTLNYVAKFTATGSVIGNSLIFDNGSNVLINKTSDNSLGKLQVSGGGHFTGNVYIETSANPTQFMLRGTNAEFWFDAGYGGGTGRMFINRQSTGNQSTLMFTTNANVVKNTAWDNSGDPWSMGLTNTSGVDTFKFGYGDIYGSGNWVWSATTSRVLTFTNTPYVNSYYIYHQGNLTLSTLGGASVAQLADYLPLAGGTMTGQIVLSLSSSSSDVTKGIRFPNDPFGGGGDIAGMRLYEADFGSAEDQCLELYVGNDDGLVGFDKINFKAPTNNNVTINGFPILNSGNFASPIQDGIISGGVVSYSGSGLLFNVSACSYIISGITYNTAATTITLTTANPTNPRIDVIAVDTSSAVVLITGTPAANPIEPQVNTLTQIQLTNITVAAGATTPSISNALIYDENAATPAEWFRSMTGFATVNYANTVAPYWLTKSIAATCAINSTGGLNFLPTTTVDLRDYTTFKFAIKLSRALNGWERIYIQFRSGISSYIGGTIYFFGPNWNTPARYGFSNTSTAWQLITISLAEIGATSSLVHALDIICETNTTATALILNLDRIELQGINNQIPTGSLKIGDKVTSGTTGSVLFVGANSILQQDNANFFWNDSNNRLGIGTATPSNQLQVYTTSTGDRGITITQASNDVFASLLTGSKIRGTSGAVVNGDNLFNFNGQGWDGSAYQIGSAIRWVVDGVVSAGNVPTSIEFRTGSNALGTARLTISSGGNITLTGTTYTNRFTAAGRLLLGTLSESTFLLDVNGTGRFRDALTIEGNGTITKNQNAATTFTISNTTAGASANPAIVLTADSLAGSGQVFKYSSTRSGYKIIASSDYGFYNATAGDISFLNDFTSGKIKFSAGGSSTAHVTIETTGATTFTKQIISTLAGVATTGAGQIYLNGGTANRIDFNGNGYAPPSFTTRSTGNKILLFPELDATKVDYAIGIDLATLWLSIPQATNVYTYKFYGGTTAIMSLNGLGQMVIGSTSPNTSAKLQIDSTTQGFLPPRMTNAQRVAITTPAVGLVAYSTDTTEGAFVNTSLGWQRIATLSVTTTTASTATLTPNVDAADTFTITAQAVGLSVANPTGTPVNGQKMIIRIDDNGTARAITWSGTQYRASTDLALPTTTIATKTMYLGFIWNSTDTKWDLIAFLNNF